MKKSGIRVEYKKLGREQVWGTAQHKEFGSPRHNVIEIDERLKGYRHLLYLIHELLDAHDDARRNAPSDFIDDGPVRFFTEL